MPALLGTGDYIILYKNTWSIYIKQTMCLYQINGLFIVYRPSVSANMLYVFQIPFHTLLPMNSTFENSGRG